MRTCSWLFAAASVLVLSTPAHAKNWTVRPGQSIQAAVDAASPGDSIRVLPGTYQEPGTPCATNPSATCAVSITKAGISLVGLGAKLENPGGQVHGIAIAPPNVDRANCMSDESLRLAGASVRGFTVNGFNVMGIFLLCVDGFDLRFNSTNDNAAYGIFPSHSTRGDIRFNVATGSHDTGIYIGQSADVRVAHNLAHGNVSGFEVENSSRVRVDHNVATGNTGGILTFALPFLDVDVNSDVRIDHNLVHGNNKPNTCLDPEDAVCAVPQGSGILAVATDTNLIDHNVVTGNDSFGIGVVNFCLANGLSDEECAALDIEPNPDENTVEHNVAKGNGGNPSPLVIPEFAKDLVWDGTGAGNCWKKNKNETEFPEGGLPACN